LALGTSLTDCAPGEVCIDCDNATDLVPRVCVPHPETDPEGFAAETASCGGAPLAYECDGPEDCATGERCIADPQAPMDPLTEYRYGRCFAGSPPCEPDGNCVVCREDADCDPGVQCAPRVQGARWPGRTCGEGLADLLAEGVWVAGAPAATDRYSWLSFSPDGEGASTGTIRVLDAECDACVGPFLPCEGQGRYSVLGGTGLVDVEGPSGCGALDGVSTWSFHTVVTDPPGYPPIALLSYFVDAGGMPMELHLRSPSYCDAAFTSCVLPDDL
jgi:hypothetical protein